MLRDDSSLRLLSVGVRVIEAKLAAVARWVHKERFSRVERCIQSWIECRCSELLGQQYWTIIILDACTLPKTGYEEDRPANIHLLKPLSFSGKSLNSDTFRLARD